tara:strand:+ start:4741 stop:4881 length:141 start_codon:yes stop_codon:yes gene_type:complete
MATYGSLLGAGMWWLTESETLALAVIVAYTGTAISNQFGKGNSKPA